MNFRATWPFILCLLLLAPCLFGQEPARPNILLLMAEDMSPKVGVFGDGVAVTPNLDRLAAEGIRYPNTFTTAGVCAPSRAAHIIGMHQNTVGAQHMRTSSGGPIKYLAVPPAEVKAYPELLRMAGYYTYTSNKLDYQFSNPRPGTGPFTIWDDEGSSSDVHWRNRPAGKPFFGFLNFLETHESGIFPRSGWPRSFNHAVMAASHIYAHWGVEEVVSPERVQVPPYYPDTPTVRKDIARQYNNIYTMDLRVGEILQQLEEDRLADSTIVIWTTDHGDGLPRAKRELFDSGIKVPMIIRWPDKFRPVDATPGGLDERLISFVDLGPTILALAGVDVPDFMQGKPFAGAVNIVSRQYVYAARDRIDEQPDRQRAVRDTRYKYIRNYMPGTPGVYHLPFRDNQDIMRELWELWEEGKLNAIQRRWFQPRPDEELYNIINDPHEVNNLAGNPDYAEQLMRMRKTLSSWQAGMADLGGISEEDMVKQFWPSLVQPITLDPVLIVDKHTSLITIRCPTEGASIGYRQGESAWQIYTGPFKAVEGLNVTAKAVRYGWSESNAVTLSMLD